MVELKRIESLGYEPGFYRLDQSKPEASTAFFTFDFGFDPKWSTPWDLVGIRMYRPPNRVNVQILHIEEDQLDDDEWPGFQALTDAPGMLSMTPPMVHALIRFLSDLSQRMEQMPGDMTAHFQRMSVDELVSNHVAAWRIKFAPLRYYRYTPHALLQAGNETSIVALPAWPSGVVDHVSSALAFSTFDDLLVADPTFDPLRQDGLGKLRFTQAALNEFIELLKGQVRAQS